MRPPDLRRTPGQRRADALRLMAERSAAKPAERCEVDHIEPYEAGGLTVQGNGRCLCKYHHRRARPPP